MDLLNNQGLGSNGGGYFVDSGNNLYKSRMALENSINSGIGSQYNTAVSNPYKMQGVLGNMNGYNQDTDLLNGQGLGQAMNAYGSTSSQPSTGQAGLSGLGMVIPALGIAGQVGGMIMDYREQQEAEKRMNAELDRQRQSRDYKAQKYMTELDRDAGRRQLAMRGQIANSQYYQQQLGKMAQNYNNTNRMNADNMEKQGLGDNSGMSAQLASQSLNNMLGSNTQASAQALGGLNRAYGGLGATAMSSAPERANYNLAANQYKEASDYGSGLQNVMRLGNTAAKSYLGDRYRDDMYNDINQGFGLGKSGGN